MNCIGPMARSAEDLALLYRIIAGPDGADTDVAPVPVDAVPALEVKGLRIAYAADFSRHSGGRRDTRCGRAAGADAGPRRGGGRRGRAARARLRRRAGGRRRADRHDGRRGSARRPGEAVAGALFRGAAATRPVDRRLGEIPGGLGRTALPGINDHRVRAPQARHAASRSTEARSTTSWSQPIRHCSTTAAIPRSCCRARPIAKACRSACSWSAGAGRSRGCWRSLRR